MACGLQGICIIGRRIFVAAWNFIVEIDYDSFQIVNTVSHPLMADLHGLATDGRNIWVTSTAIDALLCLDAETMAFKWRWGPDETILYEERLSKSVKQNRAAKLPIARRVLSLLVRQSREFRFVEREYRYLHKSKSGYHHHHLNDVHFHNGILYLTTKGWNDGIRSAVIRLDPKTRQSEFFVEPGGFRAMHDGIFLDDRFYATESGANSIAWSDRDGKIISHQVEPSPYFVRGLCFTGSSFLVGFTTLRDTGLPAKIVEYDPEFEYCVSSMDISGFYPKEQQTAIHTLVLSPED